jgi:hypothetical protein
LNIFLVYLPSLFRAAVFDGVDKVVAGGGSKI